MEVTSGSERMGKSGSERGGCGTRGGRWHKLTFVPLSPVGLEPEVVEVRRAGPCVLPSAKREKRPEPGGEPEEEREEEQLMLLHDCFMGDQVCARKC